MVYILLIYVHSLRHYGVYLPFARLCCRRYSRYRTAGLPRNLACIYRCMLPFGACVLGLRRGTLMPWLSTWTAHIFLAPFLHGSRRRFYHARCSGYHSPQFLLAFCPTATAADISIHDRPIYRPGLPLHVIARTLPPQLSLTDSTYTRVRTVCDTDWDYLLPYLSFPEHSFVKPYFHDNLHPSVDL